MTRLIMQARMKNSTQLKKETVKMTPTQCRAQYLMRWLSWNSWNTSIREPVLNTEGCKRIHIICYETVMKMIYAIEKCFQQNHHLFKEIKPNQVTGRFCQTMGLQPYTEGEGSSLKNLCQEQRTFIDKSGSDQNAVQLSFNPTTKALQKLSLIFLSNILI